ncbi:MAG TPA: hypothetical protein VG347_22335 [Verrucomicrobiae bacterium]|nr:hypothetical protein [Verrucomicrobiae bacterium]
MHDTSKNCVRKTVVRLPAHTARAPTISSAADRHLLIGTIDTTEKTGGRVRRATSLDFSQKSEWHIPTTSICFPVPHPNYTTTATETPIATTMPIIEKRYFLRISKIFTLP